MSQITAPSLTTPPVTTDVGAKQAVRPAQNVPAPAAPAGDPDGDGDKDTVTLSGAAQSTGGAGGGSELSETQATSTSVTLRQQLSSQNLSATARQNQSILALLRG